MNNINRISTIGCDKYDNKYYTVVKLFDVERCQLINTMNIRHKSATSLMHVIMSPCNTYVISSCTDDSNIIVHDVRSNDAAHIINNNNYVYDIKLIDNDYIVAVSGENNCVNVYDYKNNQLIKSLNTTSNNRCVTTDPVNYNYIICANDASNPELKLLSDL